MGFDMISPVANCPRKQRGQSLVDVEGQLIVRLDEKKG